MLKKLSLILGLIGSGFVLLQNLWMAVQFLINIGTMELTDVYAYSPLISFAGMVLLSAVALTGSLLVNKKRILAGVLLCASSLLMFVFGLLFGMMMVIPVLIIIAAGVLAFVADKDTIKKTNGPMRPCRGVWCRWRGV